VPGGSAIGFEVATILLSQPTFTNYPNPVSTSTTFNYEIAVDGQVSIKIFNSLGQFESTIFEGFKKAGSYNIGFNASGIISGIYICRLITTAGIKQSDFTRKVYVAR
jgi:hypothetical protein